MPVKTENYLLSARAPAIEIAVVFISQATHLLGPLDHDSFTYPHSSRPSGHEHKVGIVRCRAALNFIVQTLQCLSERLPLGVVVGVKEILQLKARLIRYAMLAKLGDGLRRYRFLLGEVLTKSLLVDITRWLIALRATEE